MVYPYLCPAVVQENGSLQNDFSCNPTLKTTSGTLVEEAYFWSSDEYDYTNGVNYFNCGLHNIETDSSLVTFAQNEYQRHVLSELEALASVQSGENDLMEYGHWEIYRKDGTLRFVGDNHEGYCMSKNGIKKVKKVNSPIYCK